MHNDPLGVSLSRLQGIALAASEREQMLSSIVARCVTITPQTLLSTAEKDALRSTLKQVSSGNPRLELLLPAHQHPLSVWLGSNLFGHLKPFTL